MAEEFGVARNTLRDALNQLRNEGLLEIRPGSGTYVNDVPGQNTPSIIESTPPLELVDARLALEPTICRLAVLRATERDFQRLEGSGQDIERFADGDEKFHTLLAEIAGNSMIQWMMEQVTNVRTHTQWARMRTMTLNAQMIAKYNREHRAICDAIRDRESELAAQRMRDHLGAARASLIAVQT